MTSRFQSTVHPAVANRRPCRPRIGASTPTRSPAGFTLIELILSIGAAALILIVANQVLFTSLRLRDRVSGAVESAFPLELTLDTLRLDLQGVVTPKTNGILSGSFRAGMLQSTVDSRPISLEFNTTTGSLRETEPWGVVQRVSYSLRSPIDAGGGSLDLYRGVCRNLLSLSVAEVEDQLLLRDVARIDVEAFDGLQWLPQWDTTDPSGATTNLPVAVRIRLQRGPTWGADTGPVELLVPLGLQSRTNSTSTVGG
jgi:type II secretory pathway component PulJ